MDADQIMFKYLVYYPIFILRGQNIPLILNGYNKSQYISRREIEILQLEKLRTLIKYAKEYVPYYSNTMGNVKEQEIEDIADLERLPFVTKLDIKESYKDIQSVQSNVKRIKKTTGGSTGQPVTIWKTKDSVTRELAATWRSYSWAGIDIGDRQARFWGVPFSYKDRYRAMLIDYISNRRRFSAFAFSEDKLRLYHEELMKFRPKYFYGYVSMLKDFALFIKKAELMREYQLSAIISTSEVLTEHTRELLESVFSTKVYNEYGCGEVGSIAHECGNGSMHVMSENILVEIYDGDRKCEFDEVGEVVVTELNNYAMPLIRYRIGDYAYISSSKCSCGRDLPVLGNIYGRAYDTIKNRDGKLFHGEFFMYIVEEAQKRGLGISNFQIIQKDFNHFLIKIIPGTGYGWETETLILDYLKRKFDPSVQVEFEQVGDIKREPSGKMRLIVGMESSS